MTIQDERSLLSASLSALSTLALYQCSHMKTFSYTQVNQETFIYRNNIWFKNVCVCRKLMDRHCSCSTSRQCRSAWTWNWGRPLSCATTSRGSSWHFINSLLRSWWRRNRDIRFCVLILWRKKKKKTLYFPILTFFKHWTYFRILHISHCVCKA